MLIIVFKIFISVKNPRSSENLDTTTPDTILAELAIAITSLVYLGTLWLKAGSKHKNNIRDWHVSAADFYQSSDDLVYFSSYKKICLPIGNKEKGKSNGKPKS